MAAREASTGPAVAVADARAHHRHPGLVHHRAHVGEVQVDEAVNRDQIRDAPNRVEEHVIGQREGVLDRRALARQGEQPLVGDGDQGVDDLVELVEAALPVLGPHPPLEQEGLGDHADRQRADLARHLGDDGGRAGSGAAPHAGGHEDHVRAFEDLAQAIAGLQRRGATAIRVGAAAQAAGHLGAQLHLDGSQVVLERLGVGVGGDELHAAEPGLGSWC